MCGSLSSDWKAKKQYTDNVAVRLIDNGGALTGVPFFARFSDRYMARDDKMDMWMSKGAKFVQMLEKINSFRERGELVKIPQHIDITMIAVPEMSNPGSWELKVVTRDDGMTYFSKFRKYPTFVNEICARLERSLHHRWPTYCKRIHIPLTRRITDVNYRSELMPTLG